MYLLSMTKYFLYIRSYDGLNRTELQFAQQSHTTNFSKIRGGNL
jgi:hypothetical protein